jgi:hypothetical protein
MLVIYSTMRLSSALRSLLLLGGVASLLTLAGCGEEPLLSDVSFSADHITPNADGDSDVVRIEYWLSRTADLSIYFIDQDGQRYSFRNSRRRAPCDEDPYSVLFSAVVDGYVLPGEIWEGYAVTQRVLPDGVYTWVVEAVDEMGKLEQETGTLTVSEADQELPGLLGLVASPAVFTPNLDGVEDQTELSVYLIKHVASLSLYLLGDDGIRYHVGAESDGPVPPGEPGLHTFAYDGGLLLGADPPPDGTYTVWAETQDAVGQHAVATTTLSIENGGLPQGYILGGEVEWSSRSVLLGETLYFTLTVENDSVTTLRTSGPLPGTVYASDEDFDTVGAPSLVGVFRVGIHCENEAVVYPYRWAIGDETVLEEDSEGRLYLPPYTRAVVSGGVRFVDVVDARNPQFCWAGLIHEGVDMVPGSTHVDPVFLFIEVP